VWQAAPRAADQDASSVLAVAMMATVDDGKVGPLAGQDFHLFRRAAEGVAVEGGRKGGHPIRRGFAPTASDASRQG